MATEPISVGLIMARGGGSSFYRKNAYPIHGRPVLAWAIDILKRAGFLRHIYIWTEDAQLAAIARQAGAVHLPRPREMVHYYAGVWTLGQWQHDQDRQIREHLGGAYDYIVPFNCNCINFRPESLRAMYDTLRGAGPRCFRVQAISPARGGLCLRAADGKQIFPFWNDTDKPQGRGLPPLYRTVGASVVYRTKANTGDIVTLYHAVSHDESFDFQNEADIPFAEFYLRPQAQPQSGEAR